MDFQKSVIAEERSYFQSTNRSKECFEPLWDDLHDALPGFSIDSIWIADVVNQGASYVINAEVLGDDPNYIDYSLDTLLMINKFRDRMKPPFIGVGHSMGCSQM